jgi:hypothetical protein
MKRLVSITALATALSITACQDSAAPEANQDAILTEDIALSSGAAITGDVAELVGGQATLMAPPLRAGGPPRAFDRPDCPYVPESGWHECSGTSPRGMTVSHAYAFFTAAGETQETFDPVTTESIGSRITVDGVLTTERFTATIDHERETTVSGLSGAETRHVFNGTGTRNESSQSLGTVRARASTLVSNDTVSNVVRMLPASANPWPASGSITHNIAITNTVEDGRSISRSAARRVVVTFNGTQFVPLQVGDRVFTLDLATGRVTRPVSGQ